jgi:hypothetical protein
MQVTKYGVEKNEDTITMKAGSKNIMNNRITGVFFWIDSRHHHIPDIAIYFLNGLSYDKRPTVNLIELSKTHLLVLDTFKLTVKTSFEKVMYRSPIFKNMWGSQSLVDSATF